MHRSLKFPSSNYLNGRFVPIPGDDLRSFNPAQPETIVWQGRPVVGHVCEAVEAARQALGRWSSMPRDERAGILRRWQSRTQECAEDIASLITDEMGKPWSESLFESRALGTKVDITLGEYSMARVRDYAVKASPTREGRCTFKPHGVLAVIGPFNFPAHLPNGHFVPALLMGNTIVFKPSDKTPGVGQRLAEIMDEIGMPPGVFNVVHGEADVARALVSHPNLDGILFTGSWPVGRSILEANLDHPGRMVALEMGGNNPAVIMPSAPLEQAVLECVRAGFATTGQRCTCTRRLIVHRQIADRFIGAFCRAAASLRVGPGRSEPPVFMGPMISSQAVDSLLDAQRMLTRRGGTILVEAKALPQPGYFVSPGVIQMDRYTLEHDREIFGPLVQLVIVDSLDEAIEQANATSYGLAASIFTDDDTQFERFFGHARAGCINRNTGTAGASSELPFGGLGHSGNHRPAAAFSAEYCAYPTASMIERSSETPVPPGMTWDPRWL